jgi:AcrR family transcriptional regulator
MARLNRAEQQAHNRARVLAAARQEFAERGYRDAKIDAIAERAELTRGAVYSNFPGKRALYFAVLAELAEIPPDVPVPPGATAAEALATLARVWLGRLPLADAADTGGRDGAGVAQHVFAEVLADERTRRPFTQLLRLDAVLLGLALEALDPAGGRRVGVAEAALTTLHGASQLAGAAPGFLEPFTVVRACGQLAGLAPDDGWPVPPVRAPVAPADRPWAPPPATDAVRAAPARLDGDGVVTVLGLHRLSAAEDAARAAPAGATVTAVVVTGDPAGLGPLARLAVAELCTGLRLAFPPSAWPRLQVVHDEDGAVAAAAGVSAVSDGTEVAVRVEGGRIVTRAEGIGAGHAVASDCPRRTPTA